MAKDDILELSSDNDSNHSVSLPDEAAAETSRNTRPKKNTSDGAVKGKKKKSNATVERLVKKQKLAEERAAKKDANELNKIYKPAECMKYMNVEGHPSLWSSWWCSDVSREVTATGAKVLPAPQLCHPSLVVWTRTVPRTIDKDSGQLKLTPSIETCDQALYVTNAEDIAEYVSTHTLARHLGEIKALANCSLTLVVFGVKDYYGSSRRKTSNSNKTAMSEIDFELAVTDALVTSDCDTAVVNTPNELALLIVQFTKAIAEAPFKEQKRKCNEQVEFFMRADNKKCVTVDKDGIGVGRLWQQMLAILPHSSLDTSRALFAKYNSPLALYEALQSPNSLSELADIRVSRAGVPGSKGRRVGPEFARKLSILLTAQDGNTLVD